MADAAPAGGRRSGRTSGRLGNVTRPAVTLHGRLAEQAVLDDLLTGAKSARSGSVIFRGPAGIGKTALLDYAAQAAQGMPVLRTAGVETEAELAFSGLHLLLRPVLGRASSPKTRS